MDEYARSYGHEPTENWILIVHTNNTSDFYAFDDPTEMWCCNCKDAVRDMLGNEVKQMRDTDPTVSTDG